MQSPSNGLRACLSVPIPAIFDAARYLDAAVSAHMEKKKALAEELIHLADNPAIAQWTESLWGKGGPWTQPPRSVMNPTPRLPKVKRPVPRMPNRLLQKAILDRDGHHCRFCGIPVIRAEVRRQIAKAYPQAARWKTGNANQHAGFQAMWVQYDHVLPNSRGGESTRANVIITCAPCNFGRTELTLEEVGLLDPRDRDPMRSTWDGLERFRA